MNVYNFSNNPLKPGIPTLQEQPSKAMGIQTPTFTPEQPPQKDPYDIDFIMSDKPYVSPYEAIAEKFKPRMDPEKQKRYEARAGINALGEGIRQIFETVQERQGLNVQPRNFNNAPNEALAGLNQENENKLSAYDQMLMRAKMMGAEDQQRVKQFNDQIRVNAWKTKQDNKLKADEQQFDRWYKTTALDNDNKQFLAKLAMDGKIKAADLEQRENESLRNYKARMAAVAASYYDTDKDFEAATQRNKDKETIQFINPETSQVDEIQDVSARALVQAQKEELELNKSSFELKREAAVPGSEYNLITRYLSGGGLTKEELKTLMGYVYTSENKVKTKQFSKGDLDAASKRNAARTQTEEPQSNNGMVDGFTLVDANGNPIK